MFILKNPFNDDQFINMSNVCFFKKTSYGIRFVFSQDCNADWWMSSVEADKLLKFISDKMCAIEYKE